MRGFKYASATTAVVLALLAPPPPPAHAAMFTPGVNEAFSGGISSPSREVPRVAQTFIDNSFLTDVTAPTSITGLSFRLPGSAETTYPTADITFSRYEITLAAPSAATAANNGFTSNAFADNMSNPVLVRSGSLTIPANSFTDNNTGPGPAGSAEFSYVIDFATPYLLQPGQDVVILIRHNGYGTPQQTNWNFDSFAYTNGGRVATGDADAASGPLLPDTVAKYALVYIPEPSSLAWVGLGVLATLRRRREGR